MLPGRQEGERVVLVTAFDSRRMAERNLSAYDARFRFTWYPATNERELYDHQADPHELMNRAGHASLAKDENRLYWAMLEELARTTAPSGGRLCLW